MCEPCIVLKKIVNFFCSANENSLRNTPFFLDRLKWLLVVRIPEVSVYQENAEHIRLISFHWQSETVEMRGTCLGEQKSVSQKLYSTFDNFTTNRGHLHKKLYPGIF